MSRIFMTGMALALALNTVTVWFFLPELSFADLKKLGGAAVLDPNAAGSISLPRPRLGIGFVCLSLPAMVGRSAGDPARTSPNVLKE